jgi:hypothetical protein
MYKYKNDNQYVQGKKSGPDHKQLNNKAAIFFLSFSFYLSWSTTDIFQQTSIFSLYKWKLFLYVGY